MPRNLFLAVVLLAFFVAPAASPPALSAAADCTFVLGFKTVHDMIPNIVGDCRTNEYHNDRNGDGLQETTGAGGKGGLLVWRKADNWTAFTDGVTTWINGPLGLQMRRNADRFPWEADHLLPALMNAGYRLLGFKNEEIAFRLSNGEFTNPNQEFSAHLDEGRTAFGDLDGDGALDAAVLISLNRGGSGVFSYVVAMMDRNGVPVQVGQQLLGDRVQLIGVTIAYRQITVDMVDYGPNDKMNFPTQRVVMTLCPDPIAMNSAGVTGDTGRLLGLGEGQCR